MKQHPVLFYVLLFHDLNHHPGTQLKAALKQKALGLSHGICIPGEQVLLFIRHGDQEFFFIPDNQVQDFSMAHTPYPDLSHVYEIFQKIRCFGFQRVPSVYKRNPRIPG